MILDFIWSGVPFAIPFFVSELNSAFDMSKGNTPREPTSVYATHFKVTLSGQKINMNSICKFPIKIITINMTNI